MYLDIWGCMSIIIDFVSEKFVSFVGSSPILHNFFCSVAKIWNWCAWIASSINCSKRDSRRDVNPSYNSIRDEAFLSISSNRKELILDFCIKRFISLLTFFFPFCTLFLYWLQSVSCSSTILFAFILLCFLCHYTLGSYLMHRSCKVQISYEHFLGFDTYNFKQMITILLC